MSIFPWHLLGIDPTRDEGAIQRAYARKLRRCRPDEDPENFARLVDARKSALQRMAKGSIGEGPGQRSGRDARRDSLSRESDAPGANFQHR